MNPTFIIIINLLFLSSLTVCVQQQNPVVLKGMFDKMRQDVFEEKECLPKIYGMYFKNKEGPHYSELAGDVIHSMCPSMIESCCEIEQMQKVHAKVKESFEKNKKLLERIVNLVTSLAGVTAEQIDALIVKFKEYQKSRYENYSSDSQSQNNSLSNEASEVTEEETLFRKIMTHFKEDKETILENITLPFEAYNRFGAKYGCTVCDYESHTAFRGVHSQDTKRQIDLSVCKYFYQDSDAQLLGQMTFEFYQIHQVFDFIQSFNKNIKGSGRSPNLIEDQDSVTLFERSIVTCNKELNWKTKSSCTKGCTELKLLNGNYLLEVASDLVAYDLLFSYAFGAELEYDEPALVKQMRALEKEIFFRYYLPIEGKSRVVLEGMDHTFEYGTGWNIGKHEFFPNPVDPNDLDSLTDPKNLLQFGNSQSVGKLFAVVVALFLTLLI